MQKLQCKVHQVHANQVHANQDHANQGKFKREFIDDDKGSITPLIVLYFIVIMSSIFVIANVASMYIARKELITMAEAALSKASQELDEARYYSLPSIFPLGDSQGRAIPINCNDASTTFRREIAAMSFQTEIEISKFECDGENLSATVSESSRLPFELPIFNTREVTNQVRVSVRSIYL